MRISSVVTRLLAVACVFGAAFESNAQDIEWIETYDEAFAQAKQSGKPILLTFRCAP